MTRTPPSTAAAFRELERRLLVRRLSALDGRMRLLLVLLAAYVASFTYWQARVPLDGLVRRHGAAAAATALALGLGALALAAAASAAWRRGALAANPPGPEWLALPVPPASVGGHIDREARLPACAAFVPAAAGLAAGAGLLPAPLLGAIAAGFTLAWWLATAAAIRFAARASLPPPGPLALPAQTRALLAAARPARAARSAPARWRRESAWRALARLDALVSARRSPARTRRLVAALCFLAGAAAWFAAAPPLQRRALAYAGYAAGAAALGAWAIARACADPPALMRPLPLGAADAWRARAAHLAAVLLVGVTVNVALAGSLPPLARAGIAIAWWPGGVAVALLGLHYGLTLAPRATVAENLYYGWLAVALIASWMVPLLGWGVLLAGVAHSGLRVRRALSGDAT